LIIEGREATSPKLSWSSKVRLLTTVLDTLLLACLNAGRNFTAVPKSSSESQSESRHQSEVLVFAALQLRYFASFSVRLYPRWILLVYGALCSNQIIIVASTLIDTICIVRVITRQSYLKSSTLNLQRDQL
jgi:hypothetical protein